MGALRFLAVHSAGLRCLDPWLPSNRAFVRSVVPPPVGVAARRPGPDLRGTDARCDLPSKGTERPPRFLGNPCARARVFDPGETSMQDRSACRCGLPPLPGRRLSRCRVSGLNNLAHALPVYASSRRSPDATQHSVPTGGQPWLDGTSHRVALRASHVYVMVPSSQAWPGAWEIRSLYN